MQYTDTDTAEEYFDINGNAKMIISYKINRKTHQGLTRLLLIVESRSYET